MKPIKLILFVAALAAIFLAAGLACGADKLIDAPAQVAPYKLVDAKLSGEWESAIWSIEPEAAVDSRVSADGKLFTFVAPPGQYVIRNLAVNFTKKLVAQGKAVVTIGDAAPVPPGPTPPGPTPEPPKPVPTALFGIVVEETKDRTPAQAALILSAEVEAAFKQAGGQWRTIDPWDNTGKRKDLGAALNKYSARADELKIRPALFIAAPNGTVYYEGKLPATVAETLALVAKIRKGGKL